MLKPWIKRALWMTPVNALALFGIGAWLCSLYGLDPPYAYFYTGAVMQLVAMAVLVTYVLTLLIYWLRQKFKK